MGQFDVLLILIQLLVLFFSLSLHESAHAWVAERCGDPTGRILGRVTLNPLPHVDLIGTILFPLIGFLAGGLIFGWAKPVPVNTANLRNPRRDNVLISAAGPASNLLAAAVFLAGIKLLRSFGTMESLPAVGEPLAMLFHAGLFLNVILAVFNLIPIPPLDGGWVLEGLLPRWFGPLFEAVRPFGFLLLLGLLYTGVFRSVLRPVVQMVERMAY
ncbi:MAG: site-2 protease family protein [Acidobacteriota bacterium]